MVLDFPANGTEATEAPEGVLEALGCKAEFVGRTRFDYLVEVASEEVVRELTPDIGQLKKLGVRGVIVTARGTGEYDMVSRLFAPGVGVDEDPVTGSAHCALAPYWSDKLDKTSMRAYQASRRGGVVKLRLEGDRVFLTGSAVIVMRGELV